MIHVNGITTGWEKSADARAEHWHKMEIRRILFFKKLRAEDRGIVFLEQSILDRLNDYADDYYG